jgi:hypothetical protein
MSKGDKLVDALARSKDLGAHATEVFFSAVPLPLEGLAVSRSTPRHGGSLVLVGYVEAVRLKALGATPEQGERLYAAYMGACRATAPAPEVWANLLNDDGQCLWGHVPTCSLAFLIRLAAV